MDDAHAAAEQGVSRALAALQSLLIPGEELVTHAIQRRLFALTHRRIIVGATSGRLIVVTRGLFGNYTPEDVRWQDLQDAQLRVGIFGATLAVSVYGSADLAPAGAAAADGAQAPAARLQRAREMLDQGLLTDAEFEQVKARILAEL